MGFYSRKKSPEIVFVCFLAGDKEPARRMGSHWERIGFQVRHLCMFLRVSVYLRQD